MYHPLHFTCPQGKWQTTSTATVSIQVYGMFPPPPSSLLCLCNASPAPLAPPPTSRKMLSIIIHTQSNCLTTDQPLIYSIPNSNHSLQYLHLATPISKAHHHQYYYYYYLTLSGRISGDSKYQEGRNDSHSSWVIRGKSDYYIIIIIARIHIGTRECEMN